MKRCILACLAFGVVFGSAGAQTIIKEVRQVDSGPERAVYHDVFDTRANLRLYWNKDALTKKLSELGAPADLSEQLQHAGKLAAVAAKGMDAVRAFTEGATGGRSALALATGKLGSAMLDAINTSPTDYDRLERAYENAIIRGVTTNAERQANFARSAAAIFDEMATMAADEYARANAKLKDSSVYFWAVSNVSRDDDPTRRREVPFLSSLTQGDVDALTAIQKFAKDFGGPSDLVKTEIGSARDAARKILGEAQDAVNAKLGALNAKWQTLYDKYKDNSSVATDLKNLTTAVKSLQSDFETAVSKLKADLASIRDGELATQGDAVARLSKFSAALSDARETLEGVSRLQTRIPEVKSLFEKFLHTLGDTADSAITDFTALLDSIPADLTNLAAQLESIAKGSVQTLLDALGIGLHMKQLAEIVEKGDLTKDFADIDMSNGGALHLLAGDEVIVGIKMAKSETPPSNFIESRRLYAYPDRWTSDRIIPIVFVQRNDVDTSTGARNRNWAFSPTYMDVFKRYSIHRDGDSNRWFTPGIGIAVSALDQNGDGSYEIGLGAGLTLLDDRLVAGIGFNTHFSRSYFFFGIRLRLGDIGIKG